MTTMNSTITDLKNLEFNTNEAIVYEALMKWSSADAAQIIKSTKFHKNIVYDNLHKLMHKGLISSINSNNKKIFIMNPGISIIK